MDKSELKLVFVHQKGTDIDGMYTYQFLFSSSEDVDGEEWGTFPAMGRPETPESELIDLVIEFEFEILLDLAKNSSIHTMYDAIDGVIALAYENIFGYEVYPDPRLVFKYNETYDEVMRKLSLYETKIIEKKWEE